MSDNKTNLKFFFDVKDGRVIITYQDFENLLEIIKEAGVTVSRRKISVKEKNNQDVSKTDIFLLVCTCLVLGIIIGNYL